MEPERINVCLIEDDRSDYLLTRAMLTRIEGHDYSLEWASTYEEGQEAIRACRHDVYLVDYLLGERDGLELMREAADHGCPCPLILLTGHGDIETDRAAMEAGAADYLVKGSIDTYTLERSIRYAIERKKSERALLEAHDDLERRVKERTGELAEANEKLKEEIAERERAEATLRRQAEELHSQAAALRRQAAELARADRAKDEFLAMLGHELRNPLGAISNAVEVLRLRTPEPTGAAARARGILERQVANMSRLVNDLLDVSRITRGKIELKRETVAFSDAVANAVAAARPILEECRHEFHVNVPRESLILRADSTRLEQIIGNLLHNAAKYTPPGGHVWLTLARAGNEAVLSVRDDGTGLEPDLLPHVFDLFTQADSNQDRSRGGLGLGLTLVHRLVELHGGRVEARSEGLGQGSEFVVRLPLAPDARVRDASTDARIDDTLFRRSGPSKPGTTECRRILVVDDNVDAAETLVDIIVCFGHEAETVATAEEALRRARDGAFDLVFLDIGLPDMDGYEVARRMHPDGTPLPFTLIALSGYGQEEDRRRSRAAGFHDHLTKPVDIPTLLRLLSSGD